MSIPHALLALLSEKPKYGLRLQNEFEARTGEVWPLNVGRCTRPCSALERDARGSDAGERSRSERRLTAGAKRWPIFDAARARPGRATSW
jgi:DNA-binding PadR family transcriptional regulator